MLEEWEEYKSILNEVEPYQKWAKKQNSKFKKWAASGPKRYASPYTSAAPTTATSGLGPLEEEAYVPQIKDHLNSDIWSSDGELNPEISEKLLQIATQFYNKLDLPAEILNITLTGSLANYNWTSHSDIDLHILIDYAAIDENIELVRKYLSEVKTNWNRSHEIYIKGHEIEIYVQNINEPHHSTGVYSIMDGEWILTPSPQEFEVSEREVAQKTEALRATIAMIQKLDKEDKFEEAYGDADRLRQKLSNYRKGGLESGGEYSVENLVFKALRNGGDLEILADLKRSAYDKMMSISERSKVTR